MQSCPEAGVGFEDRRQLHRGKQVDGRAYREGLKCSATTRLTPHQVRQPADVLQDLNILFLESGALRVIRQTKELHQERLAAFSRDGVQAAFGNQIDASQPNSVSLLTVAIQRSRVDRRIVQLPTSRDRGHDRQARHQNEADCQGSAHLLKIRRCGLWVRSGDAQGGRLDTARRSGLQSRHPSEAPQHQR
jgi:hypothetical protein